MKVGILMGGASREREISFAGGRTIYDNLDRNLFEPVPIFVDSYDTLIKLKWQFLYKGSIRDFYPPQQILPPSNVFNVPVYIEQIETLSKEIYKSAINSIGTPTTLDELNKHIDVAFLTLHGIFGEDGSIQGAMEWIRMPYTGSGIFASSLGIDKIKQRKFLKALGFNVPKYLTFSTETVLNSPETILQKVKDTIGFPCVIKHPLQGSSIGVQIVIDEKNFIRQLLKASFIKKLSLADWLNKSDEEKQQWVLQTMDIQNDIGLPAFVLEEGQPTEIIRHPEWLLLRLNRMKKDVTLIAIDSPHQILIEEFIFGQEFSAIVMEIDDKTVATMPPTQILKKQSQLMYDYQSKYLPGEVSKITPMEASPQTLKKIKQTAEELYKAFNFDVYARLDGIITPEGTIYFNDPNTTSGMLPSSFFFHQAAEIGLEPKDLITHIIYRSLQVRGKTYSLISRRYVQMLNEKIKNKSENNADKQIKVGVFLGGYSSERHISVESGRNVYQKLSSTKEFNPIPIFVLKNSLIPAQYRETLGIPQKNKQYSFWQIPINLLLKDNADDIAKSIVETLENKDKQNIIHEIFLPPFTKLHEQYKLNLIKEPVYIPFEKLPEIIDFAFIALHGRPGEDGDMQSLFEELNIPYNGSSPEVAKITMDKYETKLKLQEGGFKVPKGIKIYKNQWKNSAEDILYQIEKDFNFPLIAKPADEGCSTGVTKIEDINQLKNYLDLAFRDSLVIKPSDKQKLQELRIASLPPLETVLVEEMIKKESPNEKLIEITVGFVSHIVGKKIEYEVFEPSETIAEEGILSLEEKFLAGEGQNITPARFHHDPEINKTISEKVKQEILNVAKYLNLQGYARIDAFVRIKENLQIEVIFIEVNSLPGLTPATCIFHQAAINEYTPVQFLKEIIEFGMKARGE